MAELGTAVNNERSNNVYLNERLLQTTNQLELGQANLQKLKANLQRLEAEDISTVQRSREIDKIIKVRASKCSTCVMYYYYKYYHFYFIFC